VNHFHPTNIVWWRFFFTCIVSMSDEIHRKTLADLARRLHYQALLARNGGFNPLAERQAAALEAEAQAILWALEKCGPPQPLRPRL
jgi:hypothetical protein